MDGVNQQKATWCFSLLNHHVAFCWTGTKYCTMDEKLLYNRNVIFKVRRDSRREGIFQCHEELRKGCRPFLPPRFIQVCQRFKESFPSNSLCITLFFSTVQFKGKSTLGNIHLLSFLKESIWYPFFIAKQLVNVKRMKAWMGFEPSIFVDCATMTTFVSFCRRYYI